MKLSQITKLIIEAEDDKYVHIGYGKYKEKGKEDDEKATIFNKTDSGKYVKSADAEKGDDSKKDSGAKLGGGDFDRDGGDDKPKMPSADDYDSVFGTRSQSGKWNKPRKPSPLAQDKIDKLKARQAANDPDDMGPLTKKRKEKEKAKKKGFLSKMFGAKVDGPSPEDDWDTGQVMSAKLDGEEVGDIIDKGEDHPNYDKAMDYVLQFDPDDEKLYTGKGGDHGGWKPKDETITINGKQYSPIKESKKKPNSRILKENYDRIFRSRK